MGGNMQPQGHLQTLVRMLAHGQQPQAACDAPRWRFNQGLEINVEAAMPRGDGAGPGRARPPRSTVINDSYQDFGAGQFIWRLGDPAVEGYVAASDPRRDGQARRLLMRVGRGARRSRAAARDDARMVAGIGAAASGTPHRPRSGPGLALAMAGSIAFSGKAIIVKLAYRYGVDAVTLIMYRMLFALPLFALLAWWAGRGKPALTRRDWLVVLGPRLHRLLPRRASSTSPAWPTSRASLERLILYLNPTLVLALGALSAQAASVTRAS